MLLASKAIFDEEKLCFGSQKVVYYEHNQIDQMSICTEMHLQLGEKKNNTLSFINEIMTSSLMPSTRKTYTLYLLLVALFYLSYVVRK